MKRYFLAIAFSMFALSAYGQSRNAVSLDEAISGAANKIQNGLSRDDSKIVVFQFQSHNEKMSDYVLEKLFHSLADPDKITLLDRDGASQKAIDAEQNYQYVKKAGMISDESLMSLTKIIGAQAIVTGSLSK